MGSEKLSISLDEDLVATIRAAAAYNKESISAWIANAAQAEARRFRLRQALDEYALEFGAISEEEADRLIAESRKNSVLVHGDVIIDLGKA